MFQGTLWQYDNERMPWGNQSPLRTLLTIDAESVKEVQDLYAKLRISITGGEVDKDELERMKNEARDLEKKLDKEWKDEHPEENRPASPIARSQGREPTCWMFAEASLLRTKQKAPTPHGDLVEELKNIEKELFGFWGSSRDSMTKTKLRG